MRTFSQMEVAGAIADVHTMFGDEVVEVIHVGSTYISRYGGDDLDFVVRLKESNGGAIDWTLDCTESAQSVLARCGYVSTGHDSGVEDQFNTYRKGDVNLIVTFDQKFANQFAQAAEVCKYLTVRLGLVLTKAQRIKIHRIIMNGEDA